MITNPKIFMGPWDDRPQYHTYLLNVDTELIFFLRNQAFEFLMKWCTSPHVGPRLARPITWCDQVDRPPWSKQDTVVATQISESIRKHPPRSTMTTFYRLKSTRVTKKHHTETSVNPFKKEHIVVGWSLLVGDIKFPSLFLTYIYIYRKWDELQVRTSILPSDIIYININIYI